MRLRWPGSSARTTIRSGTSSSRAGPVDDLEDASDLPALGSKMGIDATRKWASEGFTRPWPKRLSTTPAAAGKADVLWEKIRKGWQ